ncbi:protein-glutamate O-methyltransferase CheR [Lamprobacter modestohalophilus]|uniref:CheR family methyltransferase n=1 Tax=Lamprobacter modestohalophilus TaxID=1064514 RepID=UPI002ADEE17C|nr:protein-glutamate O-methyltransferase CheR [Lamprobacter modestohalophilus]MEA1051912.1 protein-glutamate O-methyltransferase CheR [Lamprobacter modestohalophilus]
MTVPPLQEDERSAWSSFIASLCGVQLDASKGYLIESRLGALLRETQSGGWRELLQKIKADPTRQLQAKVISAITTNETSFFRDQAPFQLLRHKLLPELIDRRNRERIKPVPIRILSAACSTGQEVYTTAIVLKEVIGDLSGYDIRILGLDVSQEAIAAASYAHYTQLELTRGISPLQLSRYFEPAGSQWKVRDELRAMATFRQANLLEPIAIPGRFDIIFCRNVAIYFDEPNKIRLFKALGRLLAPEGALLIGSTESISGLCPEWEPQRYLRTLYYTKKR